MARGATRPARAKQLLRGRALQFVVVARKDDLAARGGQPIEAAEVYCHVCRQACTVEAGDDLIPVCSHCLVWFKRELLRGLTTADLARARSEVVSSFDKLAGVGDGKLPPELAWMQS